MVGTEKMYELRKMLRKLKEYRGSGTELISAYIPAGSPIHEMGGKLREEMSQASNIKSKSTRTNVVGALERIIQHLKMYRKTPQNGIAIFCGNVSDNPSKVDIELFSLEPPHPLQIGAYRCDSKFFLEPLDKIGETEDEFGLVVLDGREATLALMRGTNIRVVDRLNSNAHAKIRKGGQSARRYERLIEESIEKYYIRVGASMDKHFLGRIKGVMVGGPGPTKDFFMKANTFNYQIKVLGVVDTGYTDEYGLREILSKSENILAEQEAVRERVIVERFIKEVAKDGLATYGAKETIAVIASKQAESVLISEGLNYEIAVYVCSACGEKEIITSKTKAETRKKCGKCGGDSILEKEEPLLDYLIDRAKENDIKIEIISTNTVEGNQFFQGFAGAGAFLRYKTR
jgi:peptide chain release factor subunit 1